MDNIYIVMLIALAILAIADLVVGVSNDAVNFLNSAIGSKAISFKTIMIVASVGIAFGALSSSGMMEVARKGIFVPGQFYFDEIMIIFMAVMITDILLLDFFNTLGLPTSTTVSIVFELLGAAVCVSLLKISQNGDTILQLGEYINSEKATEIILGILLSVVVAFTIGALVQFASRYLLTFHFEKKPSWMAAVFGGLAITAISYFIIIKGLKSAAVLPESFNIWAKTHFWEFIGINVVIWTVISGLVISLLKTNIYKLIIIVGTFALAMAFAGNDLVNFIGVPIGGLEAYLQMEASGIPPTEFKMNGLSAKVETNPYLLLLAGIIMIATLWFSEKARRVVKTSVDLSSQDETEERFRANWLSQNLVRGAIVVNTYFTSLLPKAAKKKITNSFTPLPAAKIKDADTPAFDMVRASINLVVASVLISIATGMKLPLSTTYVTFMVAMGTSLADRAWGSDSAVYRVAGVINVIAGWFMTAFTAFVAAAIMAFLLYKFGGYALAGLLTLALFLIIRSYVKGSKDTKDFREEIRLQKAQSSSIKGIIDESSGNVSMVMKMGSKLLSNTFMHLAKQDLKALKKDRLYAEKLSDEMEGLKSHVFFYIKNLDEESTAASKLYLLIQDLLQDIVQSFSFITKTSYKHVKNNHRGLRYNQIKGLNEIESKLVALFKKIKTEFDNKTLDNLPAIIDEKQALLDYLSNEVEQQIERTKDPEASAKNTSLYFSILLECKDLVEGTTELLEKYYVEYTHSKSTDIL